MKKPLINHLTPRSGTKRAAALQARATQVIHKRLLELGCQDTEPRSDYERGKALLMGIATPFGTLEFSMHNSDRDSNIVSLFGRFTDGTDAQLDTLVNEFGSFWGAGVSRNGKWNHHENLNFNGMENLLGNVTRLVPRFAGQQTPKLFSEPAY